ncbi:sigma-54 interaction domain-containing protein [Desulfomonile tiedjei]|uniref:PAS domain S-box n=1 Tax=Desulfomonile tiedjei (strain ATCC 49306 / DSM 6799 / DCB-1) TaxID=706587 RepID=I4C529_DESTA|nr:sigma-54-dependent Fis family transcriptional regulator [Desulfomonile tiedjei]AFM24670.1 PAS domain S-box [Desulfomonile tiedjei DSM 6799]
MVHIEKELSPRETKMILDSVADGVFTVDEHFTVTYFNRAAHEITGVPVEEAIGKPCCEVFRAEICEGQCALKQTILTGTPVVNQAVFILRADGNRIPISISTAVLKDDQGHILGGVETFRDLSMVEALRKEVEKSYTFEDIISCSRKMHDLFAILPDVAMSDSTILIEGESGTGKELMAKAIHNLSGRRDSEMVTVNCGAIPDALLESELFGYKAGAFTDAKRDKPGRFAQADGGTIFLDEIGDVSPALQVRLLRVLQERKFEPLGGTETRSTNVRVLAATNRDLQTMVTDNKFREDLYYRIQVFKISLPPLRDRKEDIPILVEHFIHRLNLLRGKDVAGISSGAMAAFMSYNWPGNIRELQNAIEHAFILCRGGVIELGHLPPHFQESAGAREGLPPGLTLASIEARMIQDTLQRQNGNKAATARELGIDKTTLWRKMKRLGMT